LSWVPSPLVVLVLSKIVVTSRYQRQRESRAFFRRANVAYGLRRRFQLRQHTSTALRLLAEDFPSDYRKFILSTVLMTFDDPSARQRLSGQVIKATRAIAVESADATGWYQLSRGLCAFGFLRAAWYARENSLDLSILEGSSVESSKTQIQRGLQAKLERRVIGDVYKDLKKLDKVHEPKWIAYYNYLDMVSGSWLARTSHNLTNDRDEQDELETLVRAKSVALVAPGEIQGRYGEEIDKTEIVCRIKYVGPEYLPAAEYLGSRCDVSYVDPEYLPAAEYLGSRCDVSQDVSSKTIEKLSKSGEVPSFINDLRLILLGDPGPEELGSTRCLHLNPLLPLYRTTSTSGIRTMFALIRCKPKFLKLFGFDFYSGRFQYNEAMLKLKNSKDHVLLDTPFLFGQTPNRLPPEIAWSFCNHDPVSNFCFAQNLYQVGLFEIEPVGKSILELTPYQYVERLENMLGDW